MQRDNWGDKCDGWPLVRGEDLLVIEERMPADTAEVRQYHVRAGQFFCVLSGTLTMEVEGGIHGASTHQGVEMYPAHRTRRGTDLVPNEPRRLPPRAGRPHMRIIPATAADADKGASLLRRSITDLCHIDLGGEPLAIEAWAANKTCARGSVGQLGELELAATLESAKEDVRSRILIRPRLQPRCHGYCG